MPTVLEYLENTYQFKSHAKLMRIGGNAQGAFFVLDKTIFYPQSGGQPCDSGTVSFDNQISQISSVRLEEGEVLHFVEDSARSITEGDSAAMALDEGRRLRNAKIHTAGHLVANLIESRYKGSTAVKGHHFPAGAYVEFSANHCVFEDKELVSLNFILNEFLSMKLSVTAFVLDKEQLVKFWPNLESVFSPNRPCRLVQIGALPPIPCGGTHIRNIVELTSVRITKLGWKKNRLRVGYEVDAS